MVNNQDKLQRAIARVKSIDQLISEIYSLNKDAFEGNKTFSKDFKLFKAIVDKTIERLEYPVLSIAMVGTTSAGKSTLVNGFIGRKVAPMEQKEMSAGVLTLSHSNDRSINVHKTSKASWEIGVENNLSDEAIYSKIKAIFEKYQGHESKIAAPKISVTGPLEWQSNKSILDLPDNLSVEFIDLPGLKTIQDPKNLSVIQEMLSKAFCIVAMDFNDIDKLRIQRLLDEIKSIVKSLNNNTDFLLFLLNKIDDAKSGQISVAERIEELKGFIKNTLNLETEKEIYPFVGHLLFLIQMAVQKNENGEIVSFDKNHLATIIKECSSIFYQNSDVLLDEEYDIFTKVRDAIERRRDIDLNVVIQFYALCKKLSHADYLYIELKRRIAESFEHIIIRPTLDDFDKILAKFLGDIRIFVNVSKNTSILDLLSEKIGTLKSKLFIEGTASDEAFKAVLKEIERITDMLFSIKENINDEDSAFIISRMEKDLKKIAAIANNRELGFIDAQVKDIQESIDKIAIPLSTLSKEEDIVKFLRSNSNNRAISIFNGISDVPKEIRKSLVTSYLDAFRSLMAKKVSPGEFVETMGEKMATSLAVEFGLPYKNLYEFFYQRLLNFSKISDYYEQKVSSPYDPSWKQGNENILKSANLRVRDVLSKLTNRQFQLETNSLVSSIENYLDTEFELIASTLQSRTNIQSGDVSDLLRNTLGISKAPIQLPESLFMFSTPSAYNTSYKKHTGRAYMGDTGGCCPDPIYEDVYEDVYIYRYDNEIGCYNRWVKGIEDATSTFWKIINDWLKEQVSLYMSQIKSASIEVMVMIDTLLETRLSELQKNQEKDFALLENIENKINQIETISK